MTGIQICFAGKQLGRRHEYTQPTSSQILMLRTNIFFDHVVFHEIFLHTTMIHIHQHMYYITYIRKVKDTKRVIIK